MRTQREVDDIASRGSAGRAAVVLLAGAAAAIAATWLTGTIIDDVLGGTYEKWFDLPALRFLVEHRDPLLTSAMTAITFLGGTAFVAAVFVTIAVVAYLRAHSMRLTLFALASALGPLALDDLGKVLVDRPRPNVAPLVDAFGSAFPSGHATAATALFAALAYVLARRLPRLVAVGTWAVAMLASALVAMSRVYLGVHWPTDVVAGMALGGAWVAVARSAADRLIAE